MICAFALAYNRHLGEAVQQWAFCSLSRSAWARQFYDEKTAAGDTHHAALRKPGNRWLEILWHCLHKDVCYDQAIHTANRSRNRPPAAAWTTAATPRPTRTSHAGQSAMPWHAKDSAAHLPSKRG